MLSNNKISAPVSVADVQKALGESSSSVGRLCVSMKINMWSKAKPIRYPSRVPLTAEQRKGIDGDYGILIPEFASVTAMVAAIDGKANGWTYDRPVGGETSPYRLSDFDGYSHLAKAPNPQMNAPEVVSNGLSGATMRVSFSMGVMTDPDRPTEESDAVEIKDLSIADYFFGAYLVQDSGSHRVKVIGTSPIKSAFGYVDIRLATLPVGNYTIYPVIADRSQGQDEIDKQLRYTTLYGLKSRKVVIRESFYEITIIAKKFITNEAGTLGRVTWSVSVHNYTSLDMRFGENQIELRYASSDVDDPIRSPEMYKILPIGLKAPANTTTTIASGSFTDIVVGTEFWRTCTVWVLLDGRKYKASAIPLEPIDPGPIDPPVVKPDLPDPIE